MLNFSMPKRSVLQCGIAAVVSALMMSWLRIRPIGIFFLVLFSFWFYRTRCNLRIVPPPELEKKLKHLVERVRELRQSNPSMFCVISSGCLGVLAILGHLISGSAVVLVGLVLAAIISTKYNFKIVKLEPKDFAWAEKLSHSEADVDEEFMPEVNETNLYVLERASDLATITSPTEDVADEEEKSDEIPSELLIPDSLPEVDENSTDEEDDLVPLVKKEKDVAENKVAVAAAVAQSEAAAAMEFKKGHFKRDSSLSTSSSSSDESLSKGLQFPDHTAVDAPSASTTSASALRKLQPTMGATSIPHNQEASDLLALAVKSQTQALLANSGKILPNLVSGIVQWSMGSAAGSANTSAITPAPQTQQPPKRVASALDSSDESDFEILENDDFK